ncbi:RNA polymerase sigma factor [Candidatus Hydrogenedentota bacterium]
MPAGAVVEACISGSDFAWREFGRRYNRLLRAVISKRLSRVPCSMKTEQVEDILGRVYEKLVKNDCQVLKGIRDKDKISHYLSQAARNLVTDFVRSEISRQRTLSTYAREKPLILDPEEEAPLQEWKELEKVLEMLSARNRMFLKLHYLDGLTIGEVAEAVGMKQDALGSILYRARRTARKLLMELERLDDTTQ